MFIVENSQKQDLPDLATCHLACFPSSFASKLGKRYVKKTLEWFLMNPNRFLIHIKDNDKFIGYCGGFKPLKPGDGSSSGMLQHGFNEAILGLVRKPWLLFHSEIRHHYPFLWLNIKRKITGKVKPIKPVTSQTFHPYVGLVVIGVHPQWRGKGAAQLLMKVFEEKANLLGPDEMVLSVKKDNGRAVKAYTNYGWKVKEEHPQTFVMHKIPGKRP